MRRKAAFHNLGCKVNAYETEAMMEILERSGYVIVPFEPGADVYVVNTCTVTSIADRKSRQMLHKAKEMNPDACVVAVGCYVQDAIDVLRKDPAVDVIIGNSEKSRIGLILDGYFGNDGSREHVENINSVRSYDELGISSTDDYSRAFLKIQDGCNQFCSYCMIPYVRGRVRSRQAYEILRETERLAANGYHEIVLTGIHISSYGMDFDEPGKVRQTPDAEEARTNEQLLALIRRLGKIPGIGRIRLGSLEPGIMTEDFVAGIAGVSQICPQFHLSLQSGCDATLARMKRKYRSAQFEEKCDLIRRYFDRPAITTDIIAGFPGETEEEFAETYGFVKNIRFARTHIFKYSKRKGTKAAAMQDQVPEQTKKLRSTKLIELDAKMRKEYAEGFRGRTVEILAEEECIKDGVRYITGYTKEYVKSYLPFETRRAVPTGQIFKCRVESVSGDGEFYLALESGDLPQ